MKTNHFLHVCGSLIKRESIVPIKSGILENTIVVEANQPYSNYYGTIPEKNANPNSLFLLTKRQYSLEEILRFTQRINSCYTKNINVATAMLDFTMYQVPAIRVKFFPDYNHLHLLQECFLKQGVEFSRKSRLENNALVQVHKCFVLEEIETRIFLDQEEKNKAYIALPRLIKYDEFLELITDVMNNNNCSLFDAALAGIIIDSTLHDLVRIYTERLDIDLIRCIKNGINHALKHSEILMEGKS